MLSIEDYFWSKVIKTNSCWIWTHSKTHQGYGSFAYNGKRYSAHRFSWELVYGPVLDRKLVCHNCDNPSCVNPKHLFVGSYKDNAADMLLKGRGNKGVKLSPSIVRLIRTSDLSTKELSSLLGIDISTVYSAKTKRSWKFVA